MQKSSMGKRKDAQKRKRRRSRRANQRWLADAEFQSLVRLVRSRLDVSVCRILRESAP